MERPAGGAKPERLGIYGGTFAPVHLGHLHAAAAFLSQCALDRLLLMPAGIPPHKRLSPADQPSHRLAMLRLAVRDTLPDPRVSVSDYEITQGGVSYTNETLAHFTAPGRELLFLVGTDMFLTLDVWRAPERIFALAEIVLARRESDPAITAQIARKKQEYEARFGARITELSLRPVALSSTDLRCQIAADADLSDKVPPSVQHYLREHGLYHGGDTG